jgi:DNA polymerase-1
MLEGSKQMNKILVLDATNLLYRVYHVTRAMGGQDMVSAYMRSVNKYIRMFEPDATIAVSDKRLIKGVKNYRRQQTDYKKNRDSSIWEQVHAAEEELQQLMQDQGIHMMFPGILEADDAIAYVCRHVPGIVTIVSTDNDMAQLVAEDVQLYSPIKKVLIDVHNFNEHFPVPLDKYLTYKSIMGDASDNIAGLPGYGKVKAKRLAENYNAAFAALPELLQSLQLHNMRMMDLNQGLIEHPEEKTCYEQQLQKCNIYLNPF